MDPPQDRAQTDADHPEEAGEAVLVCNPHLITSHIDVAVDDGEFQESDGVLLAADAADSEPQGLEHDFILREPGLAAGVQHQSAGLEVVRVVGVGGSARGDTVRRAHCEDHLVAGREQSERLLPNEYCGAEDRGDQHRSGIDHVRLFQRKPVDDVADLWWQAHEREVGGAGSGHTAGRIAVCNNLCSVVFGCRHGPALLS